MHRMGTMLNAVCSCGYKKESVSFGAGQASFKDLCLAPACCPQCHSVVSVDFYSWDRACRECGSPVTLYPEVRGDKDYEYGAGETWRVGPRQILYLPHDGNRCPKCDADELTFAPFGFFD